MFRTIGLVLATAFIGLACPGTAAADEKMDKPAIKGGIDCKVKSVNLANEKLTIVTSDGRQRTLTITEDTQMVGPRGGKVRRRLHDPRFQEGMPLTIVADGNSATEIHLGYDREQQEAEAKPGKAESTGSRTAKQPATAADREEFGGKIKSFDAARRTLVIALDDGQSRSFLLPAKVPVLLTGAASKEGLHDPALMVGAPVRVATEAGGHKVTQIMLKDAMAGKPVMHSAAKVPTSTADEDEEEFPGTIKSMDASKRLLVITLLNGKDRSFLLASNVDVMVKGAPSKDGFHDQALKAGAPVTVVTEPGGKKVKEVKIVAARRKKAG
jgi:hypothetical protein